MTDKKLQLTQRELDEINLAMHYAYHLNHGTAGHNRLLLIDKLAKHLGFVYDHHYPLAHVPSGVEVEKPAEPEQQEGQPRVVPFSSLPKGALFSLAKHREKLIYRKEYDYMAVVVTTGDTTGTVVYISPDFECLPFRPEPEQQEGQPRVVLFSELSIGSRFITVPSAMRTYYKAGQDVAMTAPSAGFFSAVAYIKPDTQCVVLTKADEDERA